MLKLVATPLEWEERLPSFRAAVTLAYRSAGATYTYESEGLWFDATAYCRFTESVAAMVHGNAATAQWTSMSSTMTLSLQRTKTALGVEVTLNQQAAGSQNRVAFHAAVEADHDVLHVLHRDLTRALRVLKDLSPSF